MRNLKVIIPLKTNSERLHNKNLRLFDGEDSLFDIKAKQLLKYFDPNDIYVSSENLEVKKIIKKYGFNFHLRDVNLTLNTVKESQLVKTIVNSIPGKPDIMWCQVTQPLFMEFGELLNIYDNLDEKYDSIAVVQKFKHHIIDENGNPVNFNFGYWHKISQDLPNLYKIAWAAFIMKRSMLEEAWYQIGRKPYLFNTNAVLVDIDDMQDFEIAQILYRKFINVNN